MKGYDAMIVGGGIMGAAAAYELARRGARVALLDQAALPNPRGASVDHSKVFRFAYPEPHYVKMAAAALSLWREMEETAGVKLLIPTGLLLFGRSGAGDSSAFEAQTLEALRGANVVVEELDNGELAARFPPFNHSRITRAVFDPSGAITRAEMAVQTYLDAARRLGATVVASERAVALEEQGATRRIRGASGNDWWGDKVVIASGPWTRELLPDLADRLTATRQEVVYFKPRERATDFTVGRFPIFLETETGFYGFPIHHNGAIKVGNHLKGEVTSPSSAAEAVGEEFIDRCRAFFAEVIPALADAEVIETRICLYNNTPDDDFLIDWHPHVSGVLITTGFSGHGFKFGPLIGRIAADLLLDGKTDVDLARFRLARMKA